MQDKDLVSVMTVKGTARRLDNLAIARTPEFLRATAAVRMVGELISMAEDAFDEFGGSDRILQRDVVSNCIKVRQRGLRPGYFSHLARRFLACV